MRSKAENVSSSPCASASAASIEARYSVGDGACARASSNRWYRRVNGVQEVVRDVRADLSQAVHEDRDTIQHAVKRSGQPIEIVTCTAQRYPLREVTRENRLRCTRNTINAAEKGVADQRAPHDPQCAGNADGPDEGARDGLFEFVDLPLAVANREQ